MGSGIRMGGVLVFAACGVIFGAQRSQAMPNLLNDESSALCGSDSDCGGASCRSGKCATAPDGSCGSDSDCGHGVSCRSGKCAR